jgi:hypothetical protein
VKDGAGQKLAYVYYEEEPGDRQPSCLHAMRREGLQPTSRSSRSCCSAFRAMAVL